MRLYFADDLLAESYAQQTDDLKRYRSKLKKPDRFLITRQYDAQKYTILHNANIDDKEINMYDFFQHATFLKKKDLHVRLSDTFNLRNFKIKGIDNNRSELYQDNHKIANIQIAPSTVQLIGDVTFVNNADIPVSRDIYDRRGFKSSTQYFDVDGNLGHQIIYNINGLPVIEIIVMHRDNKIQTTGIKLLNYQGADYLFRNEDDLWSFFKDELKQTDISKLQEGK